MEPNLKNSCHVNRRVLRKAYVQALRPRTLLMLAICSTWWWCRRRSGSCG